MDLHRFCMVFHRFCMEFHRCSWIFVDFAWIFIDVHGFSQIFIDVHRFCIDFQLPYDSGRQQSDQSTAVPLNEDSNAINMPSIDRQLLPVPSRLKGTGSDSSIGHLHYLNGTSKSRYSFDQSNTQNQRSNIEADRSTVTDHRRLFEVKGGFGQSL